MTGKEGSTTEKRKDLRKTVENIWYTLNGTRSIEYDRAQEGR